MNSRILATENLTFDGFNLALPPGAAIGPSILQALTRAGMVSAQLTFQPGWLEHAVYHVAPPEPTGKTLVAYGEGIVLGRAMLLGAHAIAGSGRDDAPLLHCHGFLRDTDGRVHGGHLNVQDCRAGQAGLRLHGVATHASRFVARLDRTSRLHVFHPERTEHAHGR